MARSPLIIQRPQASLITGNQLPKASGDGVPTPDFSALAQLGARIATKEDKNKKLADQIAGTEAGNMHIGVGPDGNIVPLPEVDPAHTYEWNAARLNSAENQTKFGIDKMLTDRLNDIAFSTEMTDAEKLLKMDAAAQGVVDAAPPYFKGEAVAQATQAVQLRQNSIKAAAYERERKNTIDGIQMRVKSYTETAVSAAASGADTKPHLLKIFGGVDELVEQGVLSEESAEIIKTETGRFVEATGTQERIAGELYRGNVSSAQLEKFAQVLDTGGDFKLTADEIYGASPFNIERERDGDIKKRNLYSANDLREKFNDPATTAKVAQQLKELANFQAGYEKEGEKRRALFETLGRLGDEQSLPAGEMRTQLDVLTNEWLQQNKHLDDAQIPAMLEVYRRAKVVSPAFIDVMRNNILGNDPEKAAKWAQIWNTLSKDEEGGAGSTGQKLLDSIPAKDIEAFNRAADMLANVGRSGVDQKTSLDQWQRAMEKSRAPGNTLKDEIDRYNAAKPVTYSGVPKATFDTDLRNRFRAEYGIDMPGKFEQDFKETYHMRRMLTDGEDQETTFEETFKSISTHWTSSPIFAGGFQPGEDLTNPDDYHGWVDMSRTAFPNAKVKQQQAKYQWINDYARDQITKLRDGGFLVLAEDETKALDQILNSDMPRPLGEMMWLDQTGTSNDTPQYNILIATENGRVRLRVRHNGREAPLIIDPGAVRNHLNSKTQTRKEIDELKSLGDFERGRLQKEMFNKAWNEAPADIRRSMGLPKVSNSPLDDVIFQELFLQRPQAEQERYLKSSQEIDDALRKGVERLNNKIIELPKGVDIGPTTLLESKVAGPDVTLAAIQQIEQVLPTGTNGSFLINVAAVESDFGRAENTFRSSGDRGIMQINDGTQGAFREIQRRAKIPGNSIAEAAEKLKPLGIDVVNLTPSDLDKPLVSVAMARLYMLTDPNPIPVDPEGQADTWKTVYNTVAGAGTVGDFLKKAGKFLLPTEAVAAMPRPGEIPGAVLDMTGNANPSNFLATTGDTQAAALRLSSAFGKELRVTPHGGTQPDSRGKTSQHSVHNRRALDIYIEDYTDAEKTKLIATAIAMNWRGIGGYAAGDGKGTLHIDRRGGGNGPGGIATWWRTTPGKDGPWQNGPKWFTDGIQLGLQMRDASGA